MNEGFEKNFIPRKRIDPVSAGLKVESTVSVLNAFALIITALVVFVSAGIFLSDYYIGRQIDSYKAEIGTAVKGFDKTQVSSLASIDKKIKAVSSIVNNHISLSKILSFLEGITSSRVAINDFNYLYDDNNQKIIIDGAAKSYNSLANQSKLYKDNENISSVIITNVKPDESGQILFSAELQIKSSVFSLKKKDI